MALIMVVLYIIVPIATNMFFNPMGATAESALAVARGTQTSGLIILAKLCSKFLTGIL